MKKYLAPLIALSLTACFPPTIKPSPTPSGKGGFFVQCDESWPACYELASNKCPTGYTVVDKSDTTTATQYGPLTKRSMLIECK